MEQNSVKKKRILVMGINFSPELTGIGKYTGEMVDWLLDNGYDCTVVTSFPYYPNWKIQAPYSGRFYKEEIQRNGRLHLYRCPLYVPACPSGVKRVLHDASFFISAFFMTLYLLFKCRHSYIFCVAPPFHLGFLALLYRLFRGGKIVYHIQDLQIEAAKELKVLKAESAFSFLFTLERFIMNHVNMVSTISPGMLRRISKKTQRNVTLFPNWADIQMFHPLENRSQLKTLWGFAPADKLVVYSGSIGEKQGLESLITIAKSLRSNPSIKFIICGNGPYKERLQQIAKENGLKNIFFMSLQPLHLFNEFLNISDVHLVLQKKNACDLMLPSKLTTIWSSGGLALVTAERGSTLHSIIREHKIGVVIDCENETLLRDSIVNCCTLDYSETYVNGRRYAEKYLNKNIILKNLMLRVDSPEMVPSPALASDIGVFTEEALLKDLGYSVENKFE